MTGRPIRLMYIIDPGTSRWNVEDVAVAAVDGGADCVQVRGMPTDRATYELTRRLVERLGNRASILVNARFDIALAAGAAGVHLKDDGLDVGEIRQAALERGASPGFRVGRSVHDAVGLSDAARQRASHVTFGPVHDAHGGVGLGADEILRRVAAASARPSEIILVGGIGPGDADLARCLEQFGSHAGLAAMRHFQDAPSLGEVAARARALAGLLGDSPPVS